MPKTPSLQPTQANRILILCNPKAGARDAQDDVQRLAKMLGQRGFETQIFTDLDLVAQQANMLFDEGTLRVLVGAGGDGTAAELVNRTKKGVPISLLPRGNSNLLARYLHLGASPEHLVKTIVQGTIIHLDAGRAAEKIFLLMASCGLDAEVVNRVHANRIGHIRSYNYLKPLWDILRTYEYPELRVYWDEALNANETAPCMTARWLSVFNLPCYGGGLRFAPQSFGNDGKMNLCGFRRGGFWNFLRYISAVYLRQHKHLNDWISRRVQRVRIVSDQSVRYQLDGDPGGWLPLDIEVLPNRLTLLVPQETSNRFQTPDH